MVDKCDMNRRDENLNQSTDRVVSLQHVKFLTIVFILFFSSFLARPVLSDPISQYFDFALGFDTGDFAFNQDIDIMQLEMTYGAFYEEFDVSIFLPYLKINDSISDESGIGDLILRGGKKLHEDESGNYLYTSAALKIPTADENKGLGTGEADVGVFINYTQLINEMNMGVTAGYIVVGNSSTVNYNNVLNYGINVSKRVGNKFIYAGLEGRQQSLSTGDDPLELTGGLFYQLQNQQFFHADIVLGLSDGSPDYGISLGVTHWFN